MRPREACGTASRHCHNPDLSTLTEFVDDSPAEIARALRKGINGRRRFENTCFQTPYLSDQKLSSAAVHLGNIDGMLRYVVSADE